MADAAYNSGSHPRATGKFNETSARFIAALLAPLPDGEEPADTPAFRKLLTHCAAIVWSDAMLAVKEAQARHTIWAIRTQRERTIDNERNCLNAWYQHQAAVAAQCLVPAPTDVELRWKRRAMKRQDMPPQIAAAIAADEARLNAKVPA